MLHLSQKLFISRYLIQIVINLQVIRHHRIFYTDVSPKANSGVVSPDTLVPLCKFQILFVFMQRPA